MTNITWTNDKVKLGDLKPWADNPRMSTKAQARRILKSFDDFGQVQPVAIDPDNGVLDGHQRLSALLTIHGAGYEIDARRASRPLSDDERRALIAALHLGAVGSFDWNKLSGWDADLLKGWGADAETLKAWNNDANNLKEFLNAEKPAPADAEPAIDRAAELNEKWQVKTGDLWQIGDHRLLCGDSTKREDVARVMGGERAAMCFTSPPYNAGISAQLSGNSHIGDNLYGEEYDDNKTQVDYLELLRSFTRNALEHCDYAFVNLQVLAGNKRAFIEYWHGMTDVFCDVAVWDKRHAAPQQAQRVMDSRFEFVLIFGGNGSRAIGTRDFRGMVHNVYEGNPQRKNENADVHAATMPLDLPEHFISTFTNDAETIYEPFAGSGTALVACQNLSRKCRAIEISPNYCAVILERMATAFPELEITRLDNGTPD
jgi:DNA modification methylase